MHGENLKLIKRLDFKGSRPEAVLFIRWCSSLEVLPTRNFHHSPTQYFIYNAFKFNAQGAEDIWRYC